MPAETQAFLRWVRKNPPSGSGGHGFPAAEIGRIRKTLQAMIVFHLEREPRTLQFIKD